MASDEHGSSHFTFSVNLRPEELNPAMLQAIAARKVSREAVAENLKLTTSRGSIQRTVIDTATSTLCDGNYSDGVWTHTNPNCQDRVNYMTVTLPSDYIAVRVDLASSPLRSDAAEAH